MMFSSVLVIDRDDLLPASKQKPVADLFPSDFKWNIVNLIKTTNVVLFNEFADTGADPVLTIIFKNNYGLKGILKP